MIYADVGNELKKLFFPPLWTARVPITTPIMLLDATKFKIKKWRDEEYLKTLERMVSETKPKTILEIGVRMGDGSEQMIRSAGGKGRYFGFDLFEEPYRPTFLDRTIQAIADRTHRSTHGIKETKPTTRGMIKKRLEKLGWEINLFEGDTKRTLPQNAPNFPPMDFIYIDGGHDYKTTKSDWVNVQGLVHQKTTVVFDDYHNILDVRRVVDEIKGNYSKEIVQGRFGMVRRR